MNSYRIALTGSHGLIGRGLTSYLQNLGHLVIPLVRDVPNSSDTANTSKADCIFWNPQTGVLDPKDLENMDVIIHLAGKSIGDSRWNKKVKESILSSRVQSTKLLTETIVKLQNPPKAFICASAIGFYGDAGEATCDENTQHGSDYLAELCIAWENASRIANDHPTRVINARTGIVLTQAGGALHKMLPLFKKGLGGKLGTGKQWFSWISYTDEIRALAWLIDQEQIHGAVNLVSPNPVRNSEFTQELGKALKKRTVLPVPKFGPQLLLGKQMANELLFCSQKVIPKVLLDNGFTFENQTLQSALQQIFDEQ